MTWTISSSGISSLLRFAKSYLGRSGSTTPDIFAAWNQMIGLKRPRIRDLESVTGVSASPFFESDEAVPNYAYLGANITGRVIPAWSLALVS